jgi:hypothetical protein
MTWGAMSPTYTMYTHLQTPPYAPHWLPGMHNAPPTAGHPHSTSHPSPGAFTHSIDRACEIRDACAIMRCGRRARGGEAVAYGPAETQGAGPRESETVRAQS